MNCREPACPFPAAIGDLCVEHWRLHHGTEADFIRSVGIPADLLPLWEKGLGKRPKPKVSYRDAKDGRYRWNQGLGAKRGG